MNFLDLIKSDGYITVSKELAREIGLNETIVLSELISQYEYFKNNNQLKDQEWFYCTIDKLEKQTTLSKDQQNKAPNNLERNIWITKKLKGLPARRHFKIHTKEIKKLFLNEENADNPRNVQIEEKSQTGKRESRKQHSGKVANINNKNYNNKNNKTNNNKSAKISKKFKEVFQKDLSGEILEELLSIYEDREIIYKAILVAEQKSKGIPSVSYLFKTLKNWANEGLNDIEGINRHLKQRQASKGHYKANKSNEKNKELHDVENLEKNGWNE